MQRDFHFTATYYAARLAGFNQFEATDIAFAAEYVDHAGGITADAVSLPAKKSVTTGKSTYFFQALNTCNGTTGLAQSGKLTPNDYHRQVWAVFHFLPGNYISAYSSNRPKMREMLLRQKQLEGQRQSGKDVSKQLTDLSKKITEENHAAELTLTDAYHQVRGFRGKIADPRKAKWPKGASLSSEKFEDMVAKHLPMINRPHSPISIRAIELAGRDYREYQARDLPGKLALYRIGVTIHVYSDTWAHQDHIGAADQEFNKVVSFGAHKTGKWDGFDYKPGDMKFWNGMMGRGGESHSQMARLKGAGFYREDTPWLGHGPMGSWPDFPWACYRWQPNWSDQPIERNNPNAYLQAFTNLVKAMRWIREGSGDQYEPVLGPEEYEAVIGAAARKAFQALILDLAGISKEDTQKDPDKRSEYWMKRFEKLLDANQNELGRPAQHLFDEFRVWVTPRAKTSWFRKAPAEVRDDKAKLKKANKDRSFINTRIGLTDLGDEYIPRSVDEWNPFMYLRRKFWHEEKADYDSAQSFLRSDYFCFHQAAKDHYRGVRNCFREEGFEMLFNDGNAIEGAMTNDLENLVVHTLWSSHRLGDNDLDVQLESAFAAALSKTNDAEPQMLITILREQILSEIEAGTNLDDAKSRAKTLLNAALDDKDSMMAGMDNSVKRPLDLLRRAL